MVHMRIDLPEDLDRNVAIDKAKKGYSSKEIVVVNIIRKHYSEDA